MVAAWGSLEITGMAHYVYRINDGYDNARTVQAASVQHSNGFFYFADGHGDVLILPAERVYSIERSGPGRDEGETTQGVETS